MNYWGYLKHKFHALQNVIRRRRLKKTSEYVQLVLNQCVDITKIPPARGKTRLLQKADLLLLRLFDAFCKRNGITYMLAYGTLLGAKRHGGFVPWDDDIDTFVLADQYEFVIEKLEEEIAGTGFCLYGVDRCRLGDTTLRISHKQLPELNLDIFYLLGSRIEYQDRKKVYKARKKLHNKYLSNYRWRLSEKENRDSIKEFRKRGDDEFKKIIDACGADEAKTLWPDIINSQNAHDAKSTLPLASVQFEGYPFPAPANVDDYLQEQYGDWLSFPPRFDHHESEFTQFEESDALKMIELLQSCVEKGRFL